MEASSKIMFQGFIEYLKDEYQDAFSKKKTAIDNFNEWCEKGNFLNKLNYF